MEKSDGEGIREMEKNTVYKENIGIQDRLGMMFSGANITLFIVIAAFLTYFYTDVVGLNPGVIGTVLLVSKVFDGISDLVLGNIVDRTRTAKGVCRPWVFRIAVFFGLGIVMLFTVPDVGNAGKVAYLFIVYNVSQTLIYTISSLAVQSLPTYITRNPAQQRELYAWNNVGCGILSTLVSGITIQLVTRLGGDQKAWVLVAFGYAVITSLFLLLTGMLCKERVNPDELTNSEEKVSFWKALKAICQNKYWFLVLGIVIVGAGVYATSMQMHTYYAKYVLGDVNIAGALNSAYVAPTLILGILLVPISRYISAKRIILIGVSLQLFGCIMIIAAPANIKILTVATIFKGVSQCCGTGMFLAMLGQAIEYGQWKTGVRSQAMMVAANGAGQKIGNGVITAVLGFIMSAIGYSGTQEVQSAATMSGISGIYLYIPLVLTILQIVFVLMYDLDKKYDTIVRELQERA